MKESDFHTKLGELIDRISELPEEHRMRLQQLADETRDRHGKMKKTIGDLQESLDYLRLSIKYLVFDLEATRRENACLRTLLQGDG